ncbi:hypothetical protein ANO11243_067770 [Dothideomycetidae sp. 11243]|nr:hypothetical protein ANO11243_067770 [fungal sp. No.11243]
MQSSESRPAKSSYIRRIEQFSTWGDHQASLGLYDAEGYLAKLATHIQIRRDAWSRPDPRTPLTRRQLLGAARKLQCHGGRTPFTNFAALLLLSYCLVARSLGLGEKDAREIMALCPGAETRSPSSTLRRVSHVNAAIACLIHRGWSPGKATELFLLTRFSMSCLRTFQKDQVLDAVRMRFENGDSSADGTHGYLRVQFCIPSLIYCALSEQAGQTYEEQALETLVEGESELNVSRVCSILGYPADMALANPLDNIVWIPGSARASEFTELEFVPHYVPLVVKPTPTFPRRRAPTPTPPEDAGKVRAMNEDRAMLLMHFISMWPDGVLQTILDSAIRPHLKRTSSGARMETELLTQLVQAGYEESPFLD